MSWILTIGLDGALGDLDDIADMATERLWELGTNGVAVIPRPGVDGASDGATLLAGFATEADAIVAKDDLGGSVAPVDDTAWSTPETTTVDVVGRALVIDAGRSFGHGGHATTRLCLAALADHLERGQSVLDVGCGSGVLSLAAAVLGAGSVTAIDIDPDAIAATKANAVANDISIDVTTARITDLVGPFDVVVANMLVAEMEPIAADLRRLGGGLVIVSGALGDQGPRVTAALAPSTLLSQAAEGEWIVQVHRIESER